MSATHPLHGDEPMSGSMHPPLLYHLAYCSRASAGVDEATVGQIAQAAQRWNPAHGITGLLVFGGGLFFQWLEGPREALLRLLAALQRDARHADLVLLGEAEEARERMFPDWAMERVAADDIREVLADAQQAATDARSAQTLGDMLRQLEAGLLGTDRQA